MYLKNIQLVNFGAYRGYHKIDLTTNKNKNVILFGGKNGAGKTTFLNAIKIGLFGAFALRFKTENKEYLNYIETLLNNEAKRLGENSYSLTLQFSIEEQFKEFHYELKREWQFEDNQLIENYYLLENGHLLDNHEKEVFYDRLKEVMPPQLLDLALFDGEEISRIIINDDLSHYIRKLVSVIFNLELFETLEDDLDIYSKQQINTNKANDIERTLVSLSEEEKELKEQLTEGTALLDDKQRKQSTLQESYDNLKRDFELHGGLDKNERDQILKSISLIEADRKQRSNQIREFVAETLPLLLMSSTLMKTKEQINHETNMQFSAQFQSQFKVHDLKLILKQTNDMASIDPETLYAAIQDHLVPKSIQNQNIIHNASFPEAAKIENAYQVLQKHLPKEQLSLLSKNAEDLQSLRKLRNKLKQHDDTTEFKNTIEEIESYQRESLLLEQDIQDLKGILSDKKLELEQLSIKINKHRTLLKDFDKTSSSLIAAQKIIAVSKRYREIQIRNKLQDVQIKAAQNLKILLQKENYIHSLQISPDNFEVSLYDKNKYLLNKKFISAGEKQILLLSIIWAIFEVSHRTVPFIFDTLLGRLDQTHQASLLTSFIPSFGKQTIILSTDSEIDEQHYKLLAPYISKEYTLSFDPPTQKTSVLKTYFNFKVEVN